MRLRSLLLLLLLATAFGANVGAEATSPAEASLEVDREAATITVAGETEALEIEEPTNPGGQLIVSFVWGLLTVLFSAADVVATIAYQSGLGKIVWNTIGFFSLLVSIGAFLYDALVLEPRRAERRAAR
jgi:hypothetical protein